MAIPLQSTRLTAIDSTLTRSFGFRAFFFVDMDDGFNEDVVIDIGWRLSLS